MKILYSIIVPIYKVEKFLPQCIESILSQTLKNLELILVNDGSPDNCPEICDEYAKKDDRIKVINKENGGLVSARKAGLEAASGEYICFVDGDDFLSVDMLEHYNKILKEQKVDLICCGYTAYFEGVKTETVKQKIISGFYNKKAIEENFYHKMLSCKPFFSFYIFPTVWSKCFNKNLAKIVYEEIPNEISLGEDVAATYPAILKAETIYISNYCGYMYRQNLNSMTHSYDKDLYSKIKTLILHLKKIEKEENWNSGRQINEYILFLLILAKNNELKYNKLDGYREKKYKMNRYLKDPLFEKVLENIRLKGIKNKCLLFCFKNKSILPIYLYEKIVNPRG